MDLEWLEWEAASETLCGDRDQGEEITVEGLIPR